MCHCYLIVCLSLKCLSALLTHQGHAVPCAARAQQSKRQSASQRLRSKDKARYNRWKQTDGGKQENNDTMSASMTGSQLSTPVGLLESFLQESQQNGGSGMGKGLEVFVCTRALRLHINTEVAHQHRGSAGWLLVREKKNLAS